MASLADPFHLLAICVLISLVKTVSLVSMMTPSARHSRLLGETLVLGCEFRAGQFDLFNNPVIWKKQQHHEDVPINIQGTINQPFADSDRFRVRFTQSHPIYRFELFIESLSRADNGNYTCEIRGGTRVLANVSHEVIIKAPVEHVFITNVNHTTEPSPAEIVYTENVPGTLRCVSHGGYPAPDVQVTIGETDIGDLLSWTYTPNFEGPRGLRALSYTVERWSHTFLAQADFDGKEVLCAALVPGLPAQATANRIRVNYFPHITCDTTTAYKGERNVTLSCLVTSRPRTMSVRWLADQNGSLFDVMSSTAYWSTMRIIDDTSIQATLHISQAGSHRFKKYTLEAKNSVGASQGTVNLLLGRPPPTTTPRPLKNGSTLVGISGHETGSHYIFIISESSTNTFQTVCLLASLSLVALFHVLNAR